MARPPAATRPALPGPPLPIKHCQEEDALSNEEDMEDEEDEGKEEVPSADNS